jgi:hypothetical protein
VAVALRVAAALQRRRGLVARCRRGAAGWLDARGGSSAWTWPVAARRRNGDAGACGATRRRAQGAGGCARRRQAGRTKRRAGHAKRVRRVGPDESGQSAEACAGRVHKRGRRSGRPAGDGSGHGADAGGRVLAGGAERAPRGPGLSGTVPRTRLRTPTATAGRAPFFTHKQDSASPAGTTRLCGTPSLPGSRRPSARLSPLSVAGQEQRAARQRVPARWPPAPPRRRPRSWARRCGRPARAPRLLRS